LFCCKVDDRIELRLHEERHADALWALTEADRAHARVFLPWVDSSRSVEDSLTYIKRSLERFAAGNGMSLGIWVDNKLVGGVGFHYFDRSHKKTEIGYWLAGWMEGQGIMTRCVARLLEYAFDELKLNRVEIRCATANQRSRRIPERLGFIQEGVLRQAGWVNDHYEDHIVYSLLAPEWFADKGR
jgi:ribosomal-protein-serine acetyltransferase